MKWSVVGRLVRRVVLPARFHWPLRLARREPINIELDVVEQWMLLHLLRFERASSSDLRDVVLANRQTASEQQVRLSVIRLNSLRLIAMETEPSLPVPAANAIQDRMYRITKDGKRLRVAIQTPPRSSIQTYL